MSAIVNAAAGAIGNINSVEALEDSIIENFEVVEFPVNHHFSEGMYCRELPMPADSVITGMVHKKDHFAMLIKGEIVVTTGENSETIKAPAIIPSKAGVKRAIYAVTDIIFVTVHATKTTDLNELERELVEPVRDSVKKATESMKELAS